MSATFEVSPVRPGAITLNLVELSAGLRARELGPLEACGANYGNLVSGYGGLGLGHGFLDALAIAYKAHFPLVLSPDDVWLCIAQGFAQHVSLNAEALRERFVKHQGKVTLTVRHDGLVRGNAASPWPEVFSAFSDQIAEHVGKKRDLVVSDFSTTGPIERIASEIVLMDVMQSYFDFRVQTMCGIPRITLLGTPDDWKRIRVRVSNLSEFDLEWWTRELLPIVDQFIAASSGQVDRTFWETIFKPKGGSGGPYICGWCNVLFPYVTSYDQTLMRNEAVGSWASGLNDLLGGGANDVTIPLGLSSAPFTWEYLTQEIPMRFLGGFVGVTRREDGSVGPAIGWAVAERRAS